MTSNQSHPKEQTSMKNYQNCLISIAFIENFSNCAAILFRGDVLMQILFQYREEKALHTHCNKLYGSSLQSQW